MPEILKSENIIIDFLINKRWRVFRHAGMIIILVISFYPSIQISDLRKLNIYNPEQVVIGLTKSSVIVFFFAVSVIYSNLFVFVPTLLFKARYLYYLIICLFVAVLFYLLDIGLSRYYLADLSKQLTLTEISFKGFIDSALLPLVFLGATAGYKVFKKWLVDTSVLAKLKEANIKEELNNLKNQINPHFLFNTLNNLNTLITTDAAKASAVVLGLSDVLRYQLYEANGSKVLLKKDIQILNEFLELEKIRRDNFQYSINIEGNLSGVMVPPFIFINFVENAIKHSADNKAFSFIMLSFVITKSALFFECKNSKPLMAPTTKTGGLGLKNVKRRLVLLYENEYELKIEEKVKEFVLKLKIAI
jgi:Histidine kinase